MYTAEDFELIILESFEDKLSQTYVSDSSKHDSEEINESLEDIKEACLSVNNPFCWDTLESLEWILNNNYYFDKVSNNLYNKLLENEHQSFIHFMYKYGVEDINDKTELKRKGFIFPNEIK